MSLTDSVWRLRGPVRLTAEMPRDLLLSAFHAEGDVENRAAAGAIRRHWTEDLSEGSTASADVNGRPALNVRSVGKTDMTGLSLWIDGCSDAGCAADKSCSPGARSALNGDPC